MRYVDGFVLPVPRKNVEAYRRMAGQVGKMWREHGVLEYRECTGNDLKVKVGMPFPRLARLKPGETVVFSWIGYKSRAHQGMYAEKAMPFDVKRMAYGGVQVLGNA